MLNDAYTIRKQILKYYIVPNVSNLPVKLPYPDNFLSFWSLRKAETACNEMNSAWRDGYMFNSLFGDK